MNKTSSKLLLILTRVCWALLAISLLFVLTSCQSLYSPSNQVLSTEAHSYQCKNDVEIQCDPSGCESDSKNFTAMDVNFDSLGNLSVCAYSGCWQGHADVLTAGQFLVLMGQKLKFSTSTDLQDLALTLDRSDGVAILKVASFAQPLLCEVSTHFIGNKVTPALRGMAVN
jgi:hypothetical protein